MNIWKEAAQKSVRIRWAKGVLTPEQLFTLTPEQLRGIYLQLSLELPNLKAVGMMIPHTKDQAAAVEFAMALVKDAEETIVAEEKAAQERAVAAQQKAQKKQLLLKLRFEKEQQQYHNMTAEELDALLAEL